MRLRSLGVFVRRDLRAATGLAAIALALSAGSALAITPTFNSSGTQGTHTNNGTITNPSPSTITVDNGTATIHSNWNAHTINFAGGGTTKATAGMGRTQSSTTAKVTFASGTGVDETDPGHPGPNSGSSMKIEFSTTWDILGGNFGPTTSGQFSMPWGSKVTSGGATSCNVNIHWNAVVNGVVQNDVRSPYIDVKSHGSVGTFLDNFIAPAAVVNPSVFADNGGEINQVILTGVITFFANNGSGDVFSGLPTSADFIGQTPEEQALIDSDGSMSFDVVPEPASLAAIALAPMLLVRKRRPLIR